MKEVIIPFLLLATLTVLSCGKGPETIIAESDQLVPQADNAGPDTAVLPSFSENFQQLKIGEVGTIYSLDPLFATSNSEFRALRLVYNTLIDVSEAGEIIPSLAASWSINGDSTMITFHLRDNAYFHNNEIFSSGMGRKVLAKDVQFVFKRMASAQVPEYAALMFRDIKGFEMYRNEQLLVKDPGLRVTETISGIEVTNDSTIIFKLNSGAGSFLEKLAHPYASIYPQESVPSNFFPIQKAVGSGPYYFVKKEGDALLFGVNSHYFGVKPSLSRVDIISGLNEKDLFQGLAKKEIDIFMELGPESLNLVADSQGQLAVGYEDRFDLDYYSPVSDYTVYFNPGSRQVNEVNFLMESLKADSVFISPKLGNVEILPISSSGTESPESISYAVAHTEHPFYVFLLSKLALKANNLGGTFAMSASYAVSDYTTFGTRPFSSAVPVLVWHTPLVSLSNKNVSGIRFNTYPWNIDFTNTEVTGNE